MRGMHRQPASHLDPDNNGGAEPCKPREPRERESPSCVPQVLQKRLDRFFLGLGIGCRFGLGLRLWARWRSLSVTARIQRGFVATQNPDNNDGHRHESDPP